jgi:hypothetical protein
MEFDQEFDQFDPRLDRAPEGPEEEAAGAPTGQRPREQVPWPADAETLQELGEGEDEEAQAGGQSGQSGGFTSRTRLVMRQLQHALAGAGAAGAAAGLVPASGSKRKRVAAPAPGEGAGGDVDGGACGGGEARGAGAEIGLLSMTKGRARLDACRWFYESLVLQNRSLAKLRQEEPYGDIHIAPNLRAMAAV